MPILIQNKGELTTTGIRLLGHSNKTRKQIGRFGTGLKESIALLARNGLLDKLVIFSGTTKITFQIIGNPEEIVYTIDGEQHPLNISPMFGKHDWDSNWMILREILCNAYDEGPDFLYHEITDNLKGVAGSTRIYLPDELIPDYKTAQKRLLFLNKKTEVLSSQLFKVFEKGDNPKAQIYHRQVFIQESSKNSLFDYDLEHLKLTESRTADWYSIHQGVLLATCSANRQMATVIIEALITGDQRYLEEESISYHWDTGVKNSNYSKAFAELYGSNAMLCLNYAHQVGRVEDRGKTPIITKNDAGFKFLEKMGVPCSTDIIPRGEEEFTEVRDPTPKERELLDKLCEFLDISPPTLKMFRDPNDAIFGKNVRGDLYINMEYYNSNRGKEAYIKYLFPNSERLYKTLIERIES